MEANEKAEVEPIRLTSNLEPTSGSRCSYGYHVQSHFKWTKHVRWNQFSLFSLSILRIPLEVGFMHLQLWSLGGAPVSNVKCLRVVGENVSGVPTFYLLVQDGGVGFYYPLHMAVAEK
jgi:hypothetical protein